MAAQRTYYQLLGVPRNADLAAIKAAYRKKIRASHPDRFEADLARLRRSGNSAQIYALERKVAKAQAATQQLNEAYSVLSDPARRRQYDLTLAQVTNTQIERERYQRYANNWEDGRRSVKQRSHHDPNNPHSPRKPDDSAVPWAIMGGLLIALVVIFGLLSNFLNVIDHQPFTTYVPRQPTAQGVVSAGDLQATASSRMATVVQRTAVASAPTSTPRSIQANRDAAAALIDLGRHQLAIEPLDLAISQVGNDAELYMMRGTAYYALIDEESAALPNAIADFTQALTLDDALVDAYRARGLAFHALYERSEETALAAQALADLERYVELTDEDASEVVALVAALRDLVE